LHLGHYAIHVLPFPADQRHCVVTLALSRVIAHLDTFRFHLLGKHHQRLRNLALG
jgi:hypothetical protein